MASWCSTSAPRVPRWSKIHAITSSVSILMADLQHATEVMKKKYGPDAETVLQSQPPRLIIRVGGKVVQQERAPGQFSDARGLFVIGPRGRLGDSPPNISTSTIAMS